MAPIVGDSMARLAVLLLVCAAACGNIARKQGDDGGVPEDARRDAMSDGSMNDGQTADAAIDAPPPPPTPAREIVPGGTRMTGGNFTFDVQLGQPVGQQKASGTSLHVEGNSGVKP